MKLVMILDRKISKKHKKPIRVFVQSRNWKQIFVRNVKAVRSYKMLNVSANSCRKFILEALSDLRRGNLA